MRDNNLTLYKRLPQALNVSSIYMKTLNQLIALILLTACTGRQGPSTNLTPPSIKDTVIIHDTLFLSNYDDWQEGFGLTHDPEVDSIWGKPVKYYLDNPRCSPIAIDFYLGQFRPTDNNTTAALLSLAATDDNQLRPFYRWCLNKTILIQDGALAEYTGNPARQYAEKFPEEFFGYMDSDTTKEKYNDWVSSISYSGFYDREDYKKPQDIRKSMIRAMKVNCRNCSEQLRKRIEKFATDCFS
jgi:hypothetical protein